MTSHEKSSVDRDLFARLVTARAPQARTVRGFAEFSVIICQIVHQKAANPGSRGLFFAILAQDRPASSSATQRRVQDVTMEVHCRRRRGWSRRRGRCSRCRWWTSRPAMFAPRCNGSSAGAATRMTTTCILPRHRCGPQRLLSSTAWRFLVDPCDHPILPADLTGKAVCSNFHLEIPTTRQAEPALA